MTLLTCMELDDGLGGVLVWEVYVGAVRVLVNGVVHLAQGKLKLSSR